MADRTGIDNEWQRIAGSTQILVRSRIEIARLLEDLLQRQIPLSAFFIGKEALLISQLRHIDPAHEYVLADYGNNRMANSAWLAAPGTTFSCSQRLGTIEFLAEHPVEAMFNAMPVVRFDFPDKLTINQRRAHRRITNIPELPLHCIANAGGVIAFECKITDISVGGLGAMVYDASIPLEPGTVLKGCRISHPNGAVIEVDIEVRHCANLVRPDGEFARRAGCSFIGPPAEIEKLIRVFVLDLESRENGAA
jgi:c-di-GMP-binding flagellar brake protein YcgR